MSNGKSVIIHLIAGLIKNTLHKMSQYFPKPHEPFGGGINIKFDLSNYATKTENKVPTGIATSKVASKSDIASLKAEIDKTDVGKIRTVPTDLSELSNVVDNGVFEKNCIW